MTPPTTPDATPETKADATPEDVAFLGDLLDLQHHAVRLCRLAETRSTRRDIRAYAHAESRAQRHEITAVTSCLREWVPVVARAFEVADTSIRSWMVASPDTDTLAHVGRLDFDDCFLELMGAHHRAAIARSHVEMVDGLDHRSRDFAQTAVEQHSAGLTALDRLARQP